MSDELYHDDDEATFTESAKRTFRDWELGERPEETAKTCNDDESCEACQ